jgi:hypothetical protein
LRRVAIALLFVSLDLSRFPMNLLDSLFVMAPAGVQTRWASPENPTASPGRGGETNGGRKGRPCVKLAAGECLVLASAENTSGIVRRLWLTIDHRIPRNLRGLKIECFWDGAKRPAISAPLGDFFGTGLGRNVAFQSAFFSNPEARSFNCCLPMPFKRGMRITLTNETAFDLNALYYEVNFTVGDTLPATALYLHSHWRRENPTQLQQDYEILPRVAGRGRYLGCNIGVIANRRSYFKIWWGEGEVKIHLDGDSTQPTLCGTGTEDFIGTAWGQGRYDHPFQGCNFADMETMRYCFYRYHGPDPVWFHHNIRVTIQQIGCWAPESRWELSRAGRPVYHAGPGRREVDWAVNQEPYGLFERQDDWSSCSYFYLDEKENNLPALQPAGERIAGLED